VSPPVAVKGLLTDAERLLAEGKIDLAEICCREAEDEMVKCRWGERSG
jgi:hypothetical protein